MSLYMYIKAKPQPLPPAPTSTSRPSNRLSRLIAPILITIGSLIIANVTWPIVSHQLFISPGLSRVEFISPVSSDYLAVANQPLPTTSVQTDTIPQVLGVDLDYTNARNWFPQAKYTLNGPVTSYTLDIPAVDIEQAQVIVGGDDLNQGLIHYPNTAKPGQYGAPVIFGHSTLRQFYNPSPDNPQRYVSIFAKIMTLKTGDRIFVDYDHIRYTYEVKDKVEVKPEDLFILEQRLNRKELKLITCVPEGTYLKRGVVIAQLVNLTTN